MSSAYYCELYMKHFLRGHTASIITILTGSIYYTWVRTRKFNREMEKIVEQMDYMKESPRQCRMREEGSTIDYRIGNMVCV